MSPSVVGMKRVSVLWWWSTFLFAYRRINPPTFFVFVMLVLLSFLRSIQIDVLGEGTSVAFGEVQYKVKQTRTLWIHNSGRYDRLMAGQESDTGSAPSDLILTAPGKYTPALIAGCPGDAVVDPEDSTVAGLWFESLPEELFFLRHFNARFH